MPIFGDGSHMIELLRLSETRTGVLSGNVRPRSQEDLEIRARMAVVRASDVDLESLALLDSITSRREALIQPLVDEVQNTHSLPFRQ